MISSYPEQDTRFQCSVERPRMLLPPNIASSKKITQEETRPRTLIVVINTTSEKLTRWYRRSTSRAEMFYFFFFLNIISRRQWGELFSRACFMRPAHLEMTNNPSVEISGSGDQITRSRSTAEHEVVCTKTPRSDITRWRWTIYQAVVERVLYCNQVQ